MTAAAPRFGVRSEARTSSSYLDGELWRVSHQWEVLELADGSLFFDSIYADHRVVSRPPEALRRALRAIDEGPTSVASVAALIGMPLRLVLRLLEPLVDAGILVPHQHELRPRWASPEMAERFASQLEWFGTLADDPGAPWEMLSLLQNATVAIIGMGGAGSLLAQALTAAGVGRLVLTDGDVVDRSNLVRQILYRTDDVGRSKVECMARELRGFSPHTAVEARNHYATGPEQVDAAITDSDFVALCADAPRFVLNRWVDEACKARRIPYIGALAGTVGPIYRPGHPGCFACLEQQYRRELGARHDLLVDALARKSSWRYPSFVAGPLSVVPAMVTEIVLHITQAAPSRLAGGMVRVKHPESIFEELVVDPGCSCSRTA